MARGKYKRIYIGSGATLTGLFVILSLLNFNITGTDDTCAGIETPCISYIDFKNPTYRSVYIYNKEDVTLKFSPEDCVESYKLYVKYYGRWRFTNFTLETRLPNVPKDRIYIFVFPRYSTKYFKLELYKKDPTCDIKFNVDAGGFNLDPIFYGIDMAEELCNKKITEHIRNVPVYGIGYYNTSCNPLNQSQSCSQYKNGTYYLSLNMRTVEYVKEYYNTTECISYGAVNNSGKIYYYKNKHCKIIKDRIVCTDTTGDGLYEFNTKICPRDYSQDCIEINITTNEIISYSGYYKKPLVKRDLSVVDVN